MAGNGDGQVGAPLIAEAGAGATLPWGGSETFRPSSPIPCNTSATRANPCRMLY